MYSNDKEALIRIDEIANQIAISTIFNEWDLINEIQKNEIDDPKFKNFHSYHNSLKLAFLLLDEESTFGQIFWKSYAQTYQVKNNLFFEDLELGDVVNIIDSLEKEIPRNKNMEITLNKFKNFISQNGLLRTLSKTQVEFAPTLDQWEGFGALAVLNNNDAALDSIIHHGRSILTKIIFSIYGLRVTSGLGLESYIHREVSNKDINYLVKRNLLKKPEKKHRDRFEELKVTDFNNLRREHLNVCDKPQELLDQISFAGDIENDLEGYIGFYGIFASTLEDFLRSEKLEIDNEMSLDWGHQVSSVVSHSIETLISLITSRYKVFHQKILIYENDVALVAGLSNPGTIKNAINSGELQEIGGRFSHGMQADSVQDWLLDKKRKHKVYKPLENLKPIKDIDFTYLNEEVVKAKAKIERSKKAKLSFNDDDVFVRSEKQIFGRVAEHNRNRWEWIGKGKTFKQLNEKNSTYRKNIKRTTYKKNKSPITQDILYDLKSGYVEQK